MKYGIIFLIAYIVLAPFIGGLLEGIDRKISARMQRRIGPPVLQPFYDVKKLWHKENIAVSQSQNFLLICYLVFMVITGAMFFGGSDILMCFFVLSTGATFLFFASVITSSPAATIGANRELIQMMAYEPAVLLTAVGFYLVRGTFEVSEIAQGAKSPIMYLPGFFIAYVFILTIKFRKSPFDISTSHHMNQEIVKGLTTEMGAHNLALFTVTEWYENVFLLGVVGLFIVNSNPISIPIAFLVIFISYFFEILVGNSNARMKWEKMLSMTWWVTFFSAGVNLLVLMMMK